MVRVSFSVLICSIRIANRLSDIASIHYKSWCGGHTKKPSGPVCLPSSSSADVSFVICRLPWRRLQTAQVVSGWQQMTKTMAVDDEDVGGRRGWRWRTMTRTANDDDGGEHRGRWQWMTRTAADDKDDGGGRLRRTTNDSGGRWQTTAGAEDSGTMAMDNKDGDGGRWGIISQCYWMTPDGCRWSQWFQMDLDGFWYHPDVVYFLDLPKSYYVANKISKSVYLCVCLTQTPKCNPLRTNHEI